MREYGPGRPLVFSHIPKTAGTSVRIAIERALGIGPAVLGVDLSLPGGYGSAAVHGASADDVFLSPEDLPADATFVAGHISPATTMPRYPGADHMTILREPKVRTLSHFLHGRGLTELQLRRYGAEADNLRVAWLPLRRYLEHEMVAALSDNTMTRFLVWPHEGVEPTRFIDPALDDELFEAAVARLDQLAFVDVVENADFLANLGAWLGCELERVRANARTSVPARRRPDLAAELDPGTLEVLDRMVRIDVRVWEHVVRRVLPGTDPAELQRATFDRAVERYDEMLREPDGRSLKRRLIERAYEIRVAIDPRRRSAIR